MGGFTNYEVKFSNYVDWDDSTVTRALQILSSDVTYLYLRDLEQPRVMFCVYSHTPIESVLAFMMGLYSTEMYYRIYDTDGEWIKYSV
jgi:hypothetical protein